MKNILSIILLMIFIAFFTGCTTHIHNIGAGPESNVIDEERQWYILWGLVPINEVDTQEMAGEIENYEIKTEVTPIDFLISIPAGWISITTRTVTVTK